MYGPGVPYVCRDTLCDTLCVYSNLELFLKAIIIRKTFLQPNLTKTICDFMGMPYMLGGQNVAMNCFCSWSLWQQTNTELYVQSYHPFAFRF